MRIVTTRRISQAFFLALFLWFCIVATIGEQWWQLRGWPVNWFLQLDPLTGISTLLTTRTLFAGLLWGLATVILTLVLGRFFCGWVCPFGTMHHFVGYLAHGRARTKRKLALNDHSSWQSFKYALLAFFLAAAAMDLLGLLFPGRPLLTGTLQIGLLDPIPLVYRSVNLALVPILDGTVVSLSANQRFYDGAWVIGIIFLTALFLNLIRPRFFCRFLCPLGALFGLLGRWSIFRVGRNCRECRDCRICERNCEGACQPPRHIRIAECVLCLNCLDDCQHGRMDYRPWPSRGGEISRTDLSRRGFMVSVATGIAVPPFLAIGAVTGSNWSPRLVRPPGALVERNFLDRCIKCGQCMRVCPTNVIHPAGLEHGFEALWTPTLNFRIGSSGCQHNCIACSHICPTAAIRPISVQERMGLEKFEKRGPIRIGTAFVDRGRCLPWAMETPCIVCQENCPVSPKAIFTVTALDPVRDHDNLEIIHQDDGTVEVTSRTLRPGRFATGDYYLKTKDIPDGAPRLITENTQTALHLASPLSKPSGEKKPTRASIVISLQRPHVDPTRCIGCGVCEHECPVKGLRAIRVTAENETRSRAHSLLLKQ